jgi:hypothetical protein
MHALDATLWCAEAVHACIKVSPPQQVCKAQEPLCVQVGSLRVSLEDARRRLGAQSRDLQQQWRRGVTLGDTVRLLGDINLVVDSPQRVQRLEEAKAGHNPPSLTGICSILPVPRTELPPAHSDFAQSPVKSTITCCLCQV